MNSYGLEKVKTFNQLLPWLQGNLNWPIDEMEVEEEPFENLTFEYDPATDLGLKAEDVAHFREICQLRPFVSNQPWGIFFISFEDKKIPIGVLKRVLGGLTLKKRQSANKSDQKSWNLHDLLFVSAHGESGERELSFLHFAEENEGKNKIILKELGWDQNDTNLKLAYVANTLRDHLVWPEDEKDTDSWRENWAAAFTSKHGAAISTAKDLTKRLGILATKIRQSVNEVIAVENSDGPLIQIYENFKQTLFHNLDHDGFADMYAQTICYGLLAARIMRSSGGLVADDAALIAPLTQPFLKDLMETFLAVGGGKNKIDFNELGIDEVVDALHHSDMEAVLRDFGNKNPNEDPIIHFYEYFLKEYDSVMREQRGVYFTPSPVVKFIVCSVDEILQKEFGLKEGLADTATWGDMIAHNNDITLPEGASAEDPFVQILDPAVGTGTFLVEVIDLIEKRMKDKWKVESRSVEEIGTLWNEYVQAHLLPRLNGFELMMAPYAIAHIKIGLKLAETGYKPNDTTHRVHVYLTNTLEEPTGLGQQITMRFITDSLAAEARGADHIKANTFITVVVGNPPYSIQSANLTKEAMAYVEPYKYIDGEKIKERGALSFQKNLQDDYIKFIRFSQLTIQRSLFGIFSLITNNSYLDARSFRGMRHNLAHNSSEIAVLDLHGSAKKNEGSEKDENVFDISQGVSVVLARKNTSRKSNDIFRVDAYGSRAKKYSLLISKTLSNLPGVRFKVVGPFYVFDKINNDVHAEFHAFEVIKNIFPIYSTGVKTHRDSFAINIFFDELKNKIREFCDLSIPHEDFRERYNLKDTNVWKLEKKRNSVDYDDLQEKFQKITYRPFDNRHICFDDDIIELLRKSVMSNFDTASNIGLLLCQQQAETVFKHVYCTHLISECCAVSNKTREATSAFPLFTVDPIDNSLFPNLSADFANNLSNILQMNYDSEVALSQINLDISEAGVQAFDKEGLSLPDPNMGRGTLDKTFGPRDVFDYTYAVLHSPSYRARYADFLKSDFPRIPFPGTAILFRELVALGRSLVAFHLLDEKEANTLLQPETRFIGHGEPRVEKGYPKYENGKVMINATCHFEDVTTDVYSFSIGSYQVCEKWLKDRAGKGGKNPHKGYILSETDILHYRRITVAIRETIALLDQADETINRHGGWPDAFYNPSPEPPSIEEIVKLDENSEIEYKSTFQWDVRENKKNPDLRKSCLKTIVAFLNSKGGTLLIGVTDDKEICGLEQDLKMTKDSLDWFEQTFRNLCDDSIGVDFSQYINVRFQNTPDEKQVCIVEIDPAPEPTFLNFQMKESQPKQEFFIRRGNATKPLEPKEQHDYIKKRFGS